MRNIRKPEQRDAAERLLVVRMLIAGLRQGNKRMVSVFDLADALKLVFGRPVLRVGDQVYRELDEIPRRVLLDLLEKKHNQIIRKKVPVSRFHDALQNLGKSIGLDPVSIDVLDAIYMVRGTEPLNSMAPYIQARTPYELVRVVSILTNRSTRDVREALLSDGRLFKTGLLSPNYKPHSDLDDNPLILEGLSSSLETCSEKKQDLVDSLTEFFERSPVAELSLDDYTHIGKDLEVLLGYLRGVLKERTLGANILLYGRPGTGKTQLTRALGAALSATVFQISVVKEGSNRSGSRHDRLRALLLSQCILRNAPGTLLVMDEAEDVLLDSDGIRRAWNDRGKGWINRALEENPVPVIWLTNNPNGNDIAQLRRFDLAIELPIPPTDVRKSILRKQISESVADEHLIERLSRLDALTPADMSRAGRVAKLMVSEKVTKAEAVEHSVATSLSLIHKKPVPNLHARQNPEFDLEFLNTTPNVSSICNALKSGRSGRLLFHGVPGSGKSALAAHLAEQLEMPLHRTQAADLLSPFHGDTEQRMAAAFRAASKNNAVLLIDEADSFLFGRETAVRSWETTSVNQMLTLLEDFDGVMVATSNRVDALDSAAFRRFDIRVEFNPLTPDQAVRLFQRWMKVDGVEEGGCGSELTAWLGRQSMLCAGDFTAAVRGARLQSRSRYVASLYRSLREEIERKQAGQRRFLGFSHEAA